MSWESIQDFQTNRNNTQKNLSASAEIESKIKNNPKPKALQTKTGRNTYSFADAIARGMLNFIS